MASTYSDRLKLELQGTGENAGTWGDKTNNNLDVIDAFAAGFISKNVGGSADVTLTTANASATAESSNKVIDLNGTLTGNITVFIPAKENNYIVYNNTSGSYTLTIAATGHAANGVAITQGAYDVVYCDGASNYNVSRILSNFGAISTQDLTVTGNVNASVDANITGNAAITGNIAVTGTANVTADANVAGNVNVTSTINGSTATFTGNVNADNFVSTNELVYTDGTVGNISVRNLITTTSTSAPSSGVGDDGDFYLIHDA
jgi:cytoskeletal protein CcmA (bactofilin family)